MGGLHRQCDVVFIGVGGGGDLLPIGGVIHRQAAFRGGRAPLAVDIQPMLTIEKTRYASSTATVLSDIHPPIRLIRLSLTLQVLISGKAAALVCLTFGLSCGVILP